MMRDRRGRYMRDRARRRDMMYDARMDYRDTSREYPSRNDYERGRYRRYTQDNHMEYEQPRERVGVYDYDMRDYRGDYRRDYADYDYEKEYYNDLNKWTEKLKKNDRFNLPKEQLINNAKQMGVKFKDYDEDEFYAVYLMHVSDYPNIANEPRMYLSMAKDWLEDDDIDLEPSEKLCKYMYEIVMADEE